MVPYGFVQTGLHWSDDRLASATVTVAVPWVDKLVCVRVIFRFHVCRNSVTFLPGPRGSVTF